MFRIKICGVRTIDEAQAVAQSGADAVGLNFFPGSKRYLPPDRAAEIAALLRGRAVRVGLFVNAAIPEVADRKSVV